MVPWRRLGFKVSPGDKLRMHIVFADYGIKCESFVPAKTLHQNVAKGNLILNKMQSLR